MHKNNPKMYLQSSLFGMIQLDQSSPSHVAGISFCPASNEIGLAFVKENKLLFMHAAPHLSPHSVVDSLLTQREWLGDSYQFYIYLPFSESPSRDSKHKEKERIHSFISAINLHLGKAGFKFQNFEEVNCSLKKVSINRAGKMTKESNPKETEVDCHEEIRTAIHYLNYFTSLEKKRDLAADEFSFLMADALLSAFSQSSRDRSDFRLSLQYDKTQWSSPPPLNKIAAVAVRHYKSFLLSGADFLNSLAELLPEVIGYRLMSLHPLAKQSVFERDKLLKSFKTVCLYYQSLVKQAVGPMTQQAVQAYKSGNYIQSEHAAREALHIIEVLGSDAALAVAHYNLGASLMQQEKYKEAIEQLDLSKTFYEKLEKPEKIAQCNKKISDCQLKQDLYTFNICHHMRPIHQAVRNNDFNAIQVLYQENQETLEHEDDYGWTALSYAIFFRASLNVIQFLIEKSPKSAKNKYFGQCDKEDVWGLDCDISDCIKQYTLLRLALNVPKAYHRLVHTWTEQEMSEIIAWLIHAAPELLNSSDEGNDETSSETDLEYALSHQAPVSVIELLLEHRPATHITLELLTEAVVSQAEFSIIQRMLQINPQAAHGISRKHGITAVFAAIASRASAEMIELLIKASPEGVLEVTGSRWLSGWSGGYESDDSQEYIEVSNSTVLIYALENQQFETAQLLLDKEPALAFLADARDRRAEDIIKNLLSQSKQSGHQKSDLLKLQEKIEYLKFVKNLPPEHTDKIVVLQSRLRGFLARKTGSLTQLLSRQWSVLQQSANTLIAQLAEAGRYAELSRLAGLLSKKSFSRVLYYIKGLKWLENLPEDSLEHAFQFLNGVDLKVMAQVSKRYWMKMSEVPLWKHTIEQELTATPLPGWGKKYSDIYQKMLLGENPSYSSYCSSDSHQRAIPDSSYYRFLRPLHKRKSKEQFKRFLDSAIRLHSEKWLSYLLQLGAEPTLDAFERALDEGAERCAEVLIEQGLNINQTNASSWRGNDSVFHIAVHHANLKILNQLFGLSDIMVLPPLHQAAALGSLERVNELLDSGQPVNQADIGGYPAILWAVVMGHTPVVQQLLQRQASLQLSREVTINYHSISAKDALIALAVLFKQMGTASLLSASWPNRARLPDMLIGQIEGPRKSLLQWVAELGDLAGTQFLLSLTPSSLPQLNPLISAAKKGHGDCVKFLIAARFPVNECLQMDHRDEDGYLVRHSETALGNAAEGGHLECIKLLLQAGANAKQAYQQYHYQKRSEDPRLSFGGLPLHKAVYHIAQSSRLLQEELETQVFKAETLEEFPICRRAVECLHLLLEKTRDIEAIDAVTGKPLWLLYSHPRLIMIII